MSLPEVAAHAVDKTVAHVVNLVRDCKSLDVDRAQGFWVEPEQLTVVVPGFEGKCKCWFMVSATKSQPAWDMVFFETPTRAFGATDGKTPELVKSGVDTCVFRRARTHLLSAEHAAPARSHLVDTVFDLNVRKLGAVPDCNRDRNLQALMTLVASEFAGVFDLLKQPPMIIAASAKRKRAASAVLFLPSRKSIMFGFERNGTLFSIESDSASGTWDGKASTTYTTLDAVYTRVRQLVAGASAVTDMDVTSDEKSSS